MLGYLATAKLITGFLTPVAAFEATPEGMCHLSEGSWHESCHNTTVIPYHSTDPNVPVDSCVLTTKCNTIIPSISPIENEMYYQSTTGLNLGNNNGTLVILNPSGQSTSILDIGKAIECHPLPGSHELSCEIEALPYVSTDPKLKSSTFCQMTSVCRNLDSNTHTQNMVYYGHEELRDSDVAVENCDGRVLLHPSKRSDGACFGVEASKIREISSEKAKISHVLKTRTKDEL